MSARRGERRAMHNRALHDTLATYALEASHALSAEVEHGAEVPFELDERGGQARPLYCYRPMSDRFIAERSGVLERLPSFAAALRGLEDLPELGAYLQGRGMRADRRGRPREALTAFLCALWLESTEFALDPDVFERAYAELERTAYAGTSLSVVVARVEGLVLESEEVALGGGLSLARATSLGELPGELRGDPYATVAVLELHFAQGDAAPTLETAGRRLRRLQTALRLWDGCEPAVGPVAWARTDDGPWLLVALPGGVRRAVEDCLLPVEEEDPLRAFCALVARRSPRSGELAWALRRFELGAERTSALDALSDWLLAARALLGEPGEADGDRVCRRLAAICAAPEEREALRSRLEGAVALERRMMAGTLRPGKEAERLVAELGEHLRAVLRDVLCGHLDPVLRRQADELLGDADPAAAGVVTG